MKHCQDDNSHFYSWLQITQDNFNSIFMNLNIYILIGNKQCRSFITPNQHWCNSLWPRDAIRRQGSVWMPYGAEPLPEPVRVYCQLDPYEQTSLRYGSLGQNLFYFHGSAWFKWNLIGRKMRHDWGRVDLIYFRRVIHRTWQYVYSLRPESIPC